MNYRHLGFAIGVAALLATAQGQVAAPNKSAKPAWTVPRTADGHPDLQGVWANNIATPLERPKELEGRALLTDQEVAAQLHG